MMLVWLCIRARELPSEDLKGRAPVWNVNKSSRRRASERKKFQINNSSHRSRSTVADNDTHQPTPQSVHSRLRHVSGAVVIIRKFLLCAQQITTDSLLRKRQLAREAPEAELYAVARIAVSICHFNSWLMNFRSAFNKGKLISLCDGEMKINQWLFRDAFNPQPKTCIDESFLQPWKITFQFLTYSVSHWLRLLFKWGSFLRFSVPILLSLDRSTCFTQ